MYDELVKDLRGRSQFLLPHYGEETSYDSDLMKQAADAIEELSKDLEWSREWEKFWEKEANDALKNFQTTVAKIPNWIPVTKRLPEPMKHVLLVIRRMGEEYCHDPFISTGYVSMNKVSWWCSHDGDCTNNGVKVTHWMPLPELPKEEWA